MFFASFVVITLCDDSWAYVSLCFIAPTGAMHLGPSPLGASSVDFFTACKQYMKSGLTPQSLSVLVGTMLADGYIYKRHKSTYNFRLRHGSLQHNYISWKFEMLKALTAPTSKVTYTESYNKKDDKWYGVCSFTCASSALLGYIHSIFYIKDGNSFTKIVPLNIGAFMNQIVFAVLMADDGKFSAYHYEITCYSFSLDCQQRLVLAINSVLGLNGKVVRYSDKFYMVRFPAADTTKIASICAKHWPVGVHYKLPPKHSLYKAPAVGMGLPLPLDNTMAEWRQWYVNQLAVVGKTLGYQQWLKSSSVN